MTRMHLLVVAGLFSLSLLLLPGCSKTDDSKFSPSADLNSDEILKSVQEMYEKAKRSGEQVPESIYDWTKEDLNKINDWEYKVVAVMKSEMPEVENILNETGKNRWQCFWVDKEKGRAVFYFRRQARSYLKTLPFRELLRILPLEDAGQVLQD